ncbi:acyclic terpene utilization AtuA family protein [Natroniella sp. ANB-PHB2]|uniref:acyclic terpene utilization AtuA family protein n=1 Tax=Natroniella sp. ANB-PHB2 TaxID=3384444 RepID=UPI0038D430ED
MKEIRVLSPTAILGYGFPVESFERGLDKDPDLIAVDAGSSDPGPYYLGAGVSFTDKTAVKRDLKLMIKAGQQKGIPVIVGTAGGAGGSSHLEWCSQIVKEIAQEEGLNFKLATIQAEQKKDFISEKFQAGGISPLYPAPELTEEELKASTRIVGQMGVEPFIKALEEDAEVIIAGRAYDPTVFASFCIKEGLPAGLALHMGKIMECASIAASPGSGSDAMFGILRDDHFLLEPLNLKRKCTTTSVAAHTLYEKTNPTKLHGPGGIIDLSETEFEQYDERTVKVSGSKFIADEEYTIKLEGAKKVGYRTISIAGTRDPIMIEQLDHIIAVVEDTVRDNFVDLADDDYNLIFRIYGRDGVMGQLEPQREVSSHEVGIIIEVVAKSQKLANTICSFARSTMLHYGYPGRVATAGNLAFPYSPSDLKAGEVYEFSLHHLIKVDDPTELFPIEIEEIGN